MPDWVITLIVTVVGGVLVLLIEHFLIKPEPTERKEILTSIVLAVCPFVPLFILQFMSAQFVAATMNQQPELVRVDWYANLYAVSAMLWGWFWGAKVRPWLRDRLEGGG